MALTKRTMTTQEAAKVLGVSLRTVYNWIAQGRIQVDGDTRPKWGWRVVTASVIEQQQRKTR